MLASPRVIAIDDEETHLAGLANSLARHGIPCFQIPFTEDFARVPPCPEAEVIFADLHLGGGALASDHRTDFSTIGLLLEDRIKPSHPYLILLWTAYPDQAPALRGFLEERLHGVMKPADVLPLAKANHLDSSGNVKDDMALVQEIVAIAESLPGIGTLLARDDRVSETTSTMADMGSHPAPDAIRERLRHLFEKPDGPRDKPPPGFPRWETTMEEWLDVVLPDFRSTPRQMLSSGDEGTLALLDRFVNAIATSRALGHPRVVRDIVRHRMETLLRQSRDTDAIRTELQYRPQEGVPGNTIADPFEDWMDLPHPLFGNVTPRRFFEDDVVDAERVREVSSLLDAIDDGAFS